VWYLLSLPSWSDLFGSDAIINVPGVALFSDIWWYWYFSGLFIIVLAEAIGIAGFTIWEAVSVQLLTPLSAATLAKNIGLYLSTSTASV